MRDLRDAQGAGRAKGMCLRTATPYERRVRRAGQTCGSNAQVKRTGQTHDSLNITLKCEDMFFVYPERVQEFLEIWFLQHYLAACTVLLMAEHTYVR